MTTEESPMPGDSAEPGLLGSGSAVVDMDEAAYHRHPALSQSGAKLILSSPALYRWRIDNPITRDYYDVGHAVHSGVLGIGQPIRYIQGKTAKGEQSDGWATKHAQEQRDEARAAGEIPLLASQRADVEGMTNAVLRHPTAAWLLDPSRGAPERSLFWDDPRTGCPLRGRLDWLPNSGDPFVIVDVKTTKSANPAEFSRSAVNFGYHQQDAWYRDAIIALGLHDDPSFVFINVEKEPPYLVSVVELEPEAVELGRARNRRAIDIYLECTENDTWPGYPAEITTISLPPWAYRELDAA